MSRQGGRGKSLPTADNGGRRKKAQADLAAPSPALSIARLVKSLMLLQPHQVKAFIAAAGEEGEEEQTISTSEAETLIRTLRSYEDRGQANTVDFEVKDIALIRSDNILNVLTETKQQRARRQADWSAVLTKIFQKAVAQLGEEEARRIWAQPLEKKRGRPSRSSKPQNDQRLLDLYDSLRDKFPRLEAVRKVAEALEPATVHKYDRGGTATMAQLQRLLTKRDRLARALAKLVGVPAA
jgi:hypothetical protein